MKITTILITAAFALGAATAGAGPGGPGPRGSALCAPLTQYDTNHDGTVSTNEFAAASAALVLELQSRLLDKYDTNDDGTISNAESMAVHAAIADEWLDNLLARYDRDRDGSITTNDFFRKGRSLPRPHLEGYDTNSDGVVSAAELNAAADAIAANLQ